MSGFAPKEIIEGGNHRLEILSAETADTYGPQVAFKLKIVGGDNDGHQFTDYANRDEDSGDIKQGSKAWNVFEAVFGRDFHRQLKDLEDGLDKLTGCQFMAQVTQTRTGSRNKIEHGTVGPAPSGENPGSSSGAPNGSGGPDSGSGLLGAQQQASQAASAQQDTADDPEWESIPF
jgi:hypothetical protein